MFRNQNKEAIIRRLLPPMSPKEAIESRRKPCYGFAVIADIQEYNELINILSETRDEILNIIDPNRINKKQAMHSPYYIKQKFFHASIFGMPPLLERKQFIEVYANENGLLNCETIDKMCHVLQNHLCEAKPFLEPIKCEFIHHDGTILARFSYKTKDQDELPLLSLASQLDPIKKFTQWDNGNKLRYMTVAIVICVIDKKQINDKLIRVQEILNLTSKKLKELGRISIKKFQFISEYDKRTLSMKHISTYAKVTPDRIFKI